MKLIAIYKCLCDETRLPSLPAAWNDFIAGNNTGDSCLGPLAGLKDQRLVYEKAVGTLNDPGQTLLVMVPRAEISSLKEAARASGDLAGLGLRNQRLIINGVANVVVPSKVLITSVIVFRARKDRRKKITGSSGNG